MLKMSSSAAIGAGAGFEAGITFDFTDETEVCAASDFIFDSIAGKSMEDSWRGTAKVF